MHPVSPYLIVPANSLLCGIFYYSAWECHLGCDWFAASRYIQYGVQHDIDGTSFSCKQVSSCHSSALVTDHLCQQVASTLLQTHNLSKQAFPFQGCFPSCARLSLPFVKTLSGCGDSTHTLQIHLLCGFCYYHCTCWCPTRLCNQLHYNNRSHRISWQAILG